MKVGTMGGYRGGFFWGTGRGRRRGGLCFGGRDVSVEVRLSLRCPGVGVRRLGCFAIYVDLCGKVAHT